MLGRLKKHFRFLDLVCAALLAAAFIFLAVRAYDEYRWSDWGFGDAQTMLSVKQWDEEGWIENYMLFIPQGYANIVQLLDRPELRQHAHGTCPGSAPGVGPRLWYTHYPAGYLIPYAALFRIGFDDIFSNRFLSLLMSFGALVFMYAAFARISNRPIALMAVAFYIFSKPFLGFADTLANQPLDDLLRFYFIFALVMSTRGAVESRRKYWLLSAWFAEFGLSLCSFDSVFFIYVWLVGWDLLERKRFDWKKYLLFGMAPVTAHGLQFLQNIWYLGFDTAVLDIKVTFMLKSGQNADYNMRQTRLDVTLDALRLIFEAYFGTLKPFFAVCASYFGFSILLRKKGDAVMPSIPVLVLLFLCGLSFVLVLPHAAKMPYEARQMAPFLSVLVAATAWSVFRSLGYVFLRPAGEPMNILTKFVLVGYAAAAVAVTVYSTAAFTEVDRKPLYWIPPDNAAPWMANDPMIAYLFQFKDDIMFAKQLRGLPTEKNPVFFDLDGFRTFWDPKYVPGYPQINPIIEYYVGSKPILCFNAPGLLAQDLAYLLSCAKGTFSPVLTFRDETRFRQILTMLSNAGINIHIPPDAGMRRVMDRIVVDLTPYIQ